MDQCIRILIADDSPRSRDGLRALLATVRLTPHAPASNVKKGAAHDQARPELEVVGEAANGQAAVRLVEECRPDVVLMDARMPVMDGLEATRLIKDTWPRVKVVVLTVYATCRADALAAGADAFLVKGCPPDELLEAILNPGQPRRAAD